MAVIFKAALAWSACCQYLGFVRDPCRAATSCQGGSSWSLIASFSHMSDKYLHSRWGGGKIVFFCVKFLSTVFKAWSATTTWPGRDLAGAWSAGIDHTTYYGPSSLLPRPSQLLKWRYKFDLEKLSDAKSFFLLSQTKEGPGPTPGGSKFLTQLIYHFSIYSIMWSCIFHWYTLM